MTAWTTVEDLRGRVRRRWSDGTILRALAAGAPFPVMDLPLRGPRAGAIGDDLETVRAWISALETGSRGGQRFTLQYAPVGGRVFGRNELPSRALVESLEQAAALLGVAGDVRAFAAVRAAVAGEPAVSAWVADHPLEAIKVADLWPTLLSAFRWLRDAGPAGRYLREITAPGVDTKFVEQHRVLMAQLLAVPSAPGGFLEALGLRGKPEMLRLRPGAALRPSTGLSDITARVEELAAWELDVRSALIVENEITFLSVPVPADGLVLWGRGFEVARAGAMPWLVRADVNYWGDIDTHGFAILDRLRAWLPQTRSLLMDRETLLAHRDRWGTEPAPTTARLGRLTGAEQALYRDLVGDRLGDRLRLEQERVDWAWAGERLR